ncbi:FIST signal transduction protein [Pseudaeromonas sharmana]|uniref:FIST signal transduction protein n=1 Tax=Pseudaeromonas sharmana TaxID=328412 RepID=A0ABV8CQW6_9GAMM
MNVVTAFSLIPESRAAVDELIARLQQRIPGEPELMFVYFTAPHDGQQILQHLQQAYPATALLGCTSCQGIMTDKGYHSADGYALAAWALCDAAGAYGTAMAALTGDVAQVTSSVLHRALANSGRHGELPALIWMHASPGAEERIIAAIESELGDSVPIVGGSAAHNLQGESSQLLTQEGILSEGLALAVFFPSCEVMTHFFSTYMPAGVKGVVTRANGRELIEIDHQPAAEVYDRWTQGVLSDAQPGDYILRQTTLFPLARQVGQLGGIPYYKLSHPEKMGTDRSLWLFTEIDVGETVMLMHGNRSGLVEKVVRSTALPLDPEPELMEQIAALNVFCAGCMLTIHPDMEQVVTSLQTARDGVPFIGPYTFGEQGRFSGGENAHGNLMISHVLFVKRLEEV